MVVHNNVEHDGRVLKEATSLSKNGWNVVIIGIATKEQSSYQVETEQGFQILLVQPRIFRKLMPGKYGQAIRRVVGMFQAGWLARRHKAQVYHAHDFTGLLMLVFGLLWQRKIVYDAHELYFENSVIGIQTLTQSVFGRLRFLEKYLAQRSVGVMTVSEPIAEKMSIALSISRPQVVMNAVELRSIIPGVTLDFKPGTQVVAHTGSLTPGRHLPELVSALQYLPNHVILVLIGGGPLKSTLETTAKMLGVSERLVFVPTVPVNAVASTLSQADCAVLMFTPDSLNYEYALPNKFFESIAAGVPLVYGTTQEVNRLASQFGIGQACNPLDPRSIAQAITNVLEPSANSRFKDNTLAARQILNWEQEEMKLVDMYRRIFSN